MQPPVFVWRTRKGTEEKKTNGRIAQSREDSNREGGIEDARDLSEFLLDCCDWFSFFVFHALSCPAGLTGTERGRENKVAQNLHTDLAESCRVFTHVQHSHK